jgi:hypothetical protein
VLRAKAVKVDALLKPEETQTKCAEIQPRHNSPSTGRAEAGSIAMRALGSRSTIRAAPRGNHHNRMKTAGQTRQDASSPRRTIAARVAVQRALTLLLHRSCADVPQHDQSTPSQTRRPHRFVAACTASDTHSRNAHGSVGSHYARGECDDTRDRGSGMRPGHGLDVVARSNSVAGSVPSRAWRN